MAKTPPPQYKNLALDLIQIQPQVRTIFTDQGIQELADSIRQIGVIQAVTIRVGATPEPTEADPDPLPEYTLVAGERRCRAARLAGLTKVPAVLRHLTEQEVREIQLTENIQREGLSPMEEAVTFRQLVEQMAYTPSEIAVRLGKSADFVHKRLRLANLIPEAQQLVHDHVMLLQVADLLAPLNEADQQTMLKHIVKRDVVRGPEDKPDEQLSRTYCEPVAKVRWALNQYVLRRLDRAPWPKDRKIAGVDAPACVACPMRSGREDMGNLFADLLPGEQCLVTKCYQAKFTAYFKNLAVDLEKQYGTPVPYIVTNYQTAYPKEASYAHNWKELTEKEKCPNAKMYCLLNRDGTHAVLRGCTEYQCTCRQAAKQKAASAAATTAYTGGVTTYTKQQYQKAVKDAVKANVAEQLPKELVARLSAATTTSATTTKALAIIRIAAFLADEQVREVMVLAGLPEWAGAPEDTDRLRLLAEHADKHEAILWKLVLLEMLEDSFQGDLIEQVAREQMGDALDMMQKEVHKAVKSQVTQQLAEYQPDEQGVYHIPTSLRFEVNMSEGKAG